jgi:translocation and assembly module TamB
MGWHVNMNVDLGDKVHLKGYGLEGRLAGSLGLDAPPRQPTRATGSVEIREGRYELYGTKFDIQRGRLVYTGGPIDDPGIDVQVGREVRDVSVTLAATGPLTDPDLSMTSTPAMSDTDKMSYLLLGRPSSEASGAELGVLVRAAASLIPGGGSDVQGRIRSTLGLDTLELRADSPNGEGASVELGKYLSPRLYVSYVSGFQQAVDVFRVHYDLARHWLLRAESSSRESSGDLLLTW